MEKFFINAKLMEKGVLLERATISLPESKQKIENLAKELGFSDVEDADIVYDTNLPEEITNYIEYGCYMTEDKGRTLVNLGRQYTRCEKLKLYNKFALCLDDLYNSNYSEDFITRFVYAFAEHSAIIVEADNLPEWYCIKESENESGIGSLAFLVKGTANFQKGNYGFFDYSEVDGDVYTLGSWDIDEYEGETIEDYDDDPVEYLEALAESYDLYISEDERYILDIYYEDEDSEKSYENQIETRLIELGY